MSDKKPKGRSPAEIWEELVVSQKACDGFASQVRLDLELGSKTAPAEEDVDRLVRVRGRISALLTDLSYAGVLDEISAFLASKYGRRW